MSAGRAPKIRRHPERGSKVLKLIDRYAGIPFVCLLGLFRPRRAGDPPREPRRIGLLQTAAIGDTVLSSAIVANLKHLFPDAHLSFFTGASNYEIACLIPGIDSVVKLPIASPVEAIGMIRSAGTFDLWIDFGPWPRLNAVLTFFARADVKTGFKTAGQHRHAVYDRIALHSEEAHELGNYRMLLRAAGIAVDDSPPELLRETVPVVQDRIVAHLFPGGSRSYLKEWPEDRWAGLLDALAERGMTIFLTGAGVDRERALHVRDLMKNRNAVQVVAGKQDMKAVVQLLQSSRLVISVDTGIMHIASALGVDLVSLHGPTAPDRWGPLNRNAAAIRSAGGCRPCISLGFDSDCEDPRCMQRITVDEVLAAVEGMLSRPVRSGGPGTD